MSKFGLIGRNIEYSFSRNYFREKFRKEHPAFTYENFDLQNISEIQGVLKTPRLTGLNVTIPYKEEIMSFLDKIDPVAKKIGAVNTVKIFPNGSTKGYNTDYIGFRNSLSTHFKSSKKAALILGTGGASKAIAYALRSLDFDFKFVSRKSQKNFLKYAQINREVIQNYLLIINCTPLGTYPKIHERPDIPYQFLTADHFLFDLVYNPEETEFLKFGKIFGAQTLNGLEMLINQAEESWKIWTIDS